MRSSPLCFRCRAGRTWRTDPCSSVPCGQNQTVVGKERFGYDGLDRRLVLRRGGIERGEERGTHQATSRWWCADRLELLLLDGFASEVQRLLQVGVVESSSVNVLRVNGN